MTHTSPPVPDLTSETQYCGLKGTSVIDEPKEFDIDLGKWRILTF